MKQCLPTMSLSVIFLAIGTMAANAQSFSCADAANSAEFAICNNEDLLILDERLAALYFSKRRSIIEGPSKEAIFETQLNWIRQRNACRLNWDCLKSSYRERIGQLSS